MAGWYFVAGLIWVCEKDIDVCVNANMKVNIRGGCADFWIRYKCAEHGAQVARSQPK